MADEENLEQQARLQAEIDRLTAELTASQTNTAAARAASTVQAVGVKIGPFWKQNAILWFQQLEAQFHLARVTQSDTKYYHVISKIDSEVLQCCSDLIQSFESPASPAVTDKYDKIKARIIAEYAISEESRMHMILHQCELGDRRPSQLLREMRSLAAGVVTDDNLIRKLWLQRLPETVQAVLKVLEDTIDVQMLATKADQLLEVTKGSASNVMALQATPPPSELQEIKEQIQVLTLEIAAFRRDRRDNPPGPGKRNEQRGATNRQDPDICQYHRRYGEKARNCRPWCKFQKN